jgi:hypothetical protein
VTAAEMFARIGAGVAMFAVAGVLYVIAGWIANSREESVEPLPSEDGDVELDDFRLHDGGETCFRCRNKPNEPGSLWCAACARVIHLLDLADTRPVKEK